MHPRRGRIIFEQGHEVTKHGHLLGTERRERLVTDYVPLQHLPAFYRGLFGLVDIARRIAPQIDPLAEGVRDLRLLAGLAQFSKMISQRRLGEQMDRYTAMMAKSIGLRPMCLDQRSADMGRI